MPCTCPNINCTQNTINEIVYCNCSTIIQNIQCPIGCTTQILPNGNAVCVCTQTVTPIINKNIPPIYFDNPNYFTDVSWTISYKASEGSWNSYFSFYPDFSPFHNSFFQVGYNWGIDKGTVWNHLLNRSSFGVFQGKKNKPILEFIVPNENANKILNSISLNLEGRHYLNDWDFTIDKNKTFKNLFIFNQTDNSGMLELNPQQSLSDIRKYPISDVNLQKILFTSDNGKQNINYFFNRMKNEQSGIPMFITDKNNIFKTLNTNAVSFKGKRVLERLRGEYFQVHLEGHEDSRYNLILKNTINNETITE